MNIDVDKIVVSLDLVAPDAVVVEASAVAPSGIITEAVAELPTQVIVISHEETPTVSPLEIIDYGSSSIECAFDVATEQAEEVVKGVLCGTINPPTFENADYRLLHGQGNIDLAFAGLHKNTEYYLRPYALSNLGYKYGDVVAQRTKNNPIPDEYQLVEYLQQQPDGGQYIKLGFYLSGNTSRIILFSKNGGFFGSRRGPAVESFLSLYAAYVNFRFDYGSDQYNTATVVNRDYIIDFNKNNVALYEGEDLATAVLVSSNVFNLSSFVSPECYLMTFNNGGSPYITSQYSVAKYKHFMHYENDELLQNLYSVYRKADNKPGMYDIVNNTFYTNQGTGEFTVGPDKEWEE